MNTLSKALFQKSLKDIDCKAIVHPSYETCFESVLSNYVEGIKGTGKFYFFIYLVM